MSELAKWSNFYTIVGSAAGALIGLQFVVLTLLADHPPEGAGAEQAGAAFGSPTVVHFGAVVFLAAMLLAPWPSITMAAVVWGCGGLAGIIYSVIILRRIRNQPLYKPVAEDWVFYCVLPLGAYGILAASAFTATFYTRESLFALGAGELLLLFIGIHNAWDSVSYHVLVNIAGSRRRGKPKDERE